MDNKEWGVTICTKCGGEKPDNGRSWCSACQGESARVYQRTKKGLVVQIYSGQRASSKTRGHSMPEYTRLDLQAWLFEQELFHMLHKDWVESGYDRMLSPSVDRIDDDVHYKFDNIQLMTWGENIDKGHISTAIRQGKAVEVLRGGAVVGIFVSLSEAGRVLGDIDRNSLGLALKHNKTTKGYTVRRVNPDAS